MHDRHRELASLQDLLKNPGPDGLAGLAAWVSRNFASGRLPAREQAIAREILLILVNDATEKVRAAISEQIKSCHWLPRDLALKLASDVEPVALPLLEHCKAMEDEDLLYVLAQGSQAKAQAIARREGVTEEVCAAICDRRKVTAIKVLLDNHQAQIAEATLLSVLKAFEEDAEIHGLLVARPALPVGVLERLIDLVTDDLLHEITKRHDLPVQLVSRIALLSRERLLSDQLRARPAPNELAALTEELRRTRRLTPTLMFRGLLLGEHAFFVKGVALLTGKSVEAVDEILETGEASEKRGLLLRAGMPMGLMRPIDCVLSELRETRADHQPIDARAFFGRAVDRLCANCPEFMPGPPEEIMNQALHLAKTGS